MYTLKYRGVKREVSRDALMVSKIFKGMLEDAGDDDGETKEAIEIPDTVIRPNEFLVEKMIDVLVYESDTANEKLAMIEKPVSSMWPEFISNQFYILILNDIKDKGKPFPEEEAANDEAKKKSNIETEIRNMYDLILLSNYLGVDSMLELSCAYVASLIKYKITDEDKMKTLIEDTKKLEVSTSA